MAIDNCKILKYTGDRQFHNLTTEKVIMNIDTSFFEELNFKLHKHFSLDFKLYQRTITNNFYIGSVLEASAEGIGTLKSMYWQISFRAII